MTTTTNSQPASTWIKDRFGDYIRFGSNYGIARAHRGWAIYLRGIKVTALPTLKAAKAQVEIWLEAEEQDRADRAEDLELEMASRGFRTVR